MQLARHIIKQKTFCKNAASKNNVRNEKAKEGVSSSLETEDNLIMEYVEKTKVFYACFTSVFTNTASSQMISTVDSKDRGRNNQPRIGRAQAGDYLEKLDIFTSAEPMRFIVEH